MAGVSNSLILYPFLRDELSFFNVFSVLCFQTSSNVENFSPQIIKQVAREIHTLASNPPEGIKIYTNDEDITDIQATIEGPSKYNSHRVKNSLVQKSLRLYLQTVYVRLNF